MVSGVWIPGFEFLIWIPGFGLMGRDPWVWIPGSGFMDFYLWDQIPGFGFIGLYSRACNFSRYLRGDWAWKPFLLHALRNLARVVGGTLLWKAGLEGAGKDSFNTTDSHLNQC